MDDMLNWLWLSDIFFHYFIVGVGVFSDYTQAFWCIFHK